MRIIIAGESFPDCGAVLAPLLPGDEVFHCPLPELAERARSADVLIPCMTRIGGDVIRGSGLKLIQQWGVGLEGVDMAAAAAEGVPVANVPADAAPGNIDSTSEQALFLMLAAARRFHIAQQRLRTGPWGSPIGLALSGRKALIVGLGRIGRALAGKLIALNMEVSAVKRTPDPQQAADIGLARLGGPEDLFDLLPAADFVVATVTANPGSLGMFDAAAFGRMKPGAFFINVSRGAVVDEGALLEALESGRLAGAGLDVFASEPVDPDHPLLAQPNLTAMPHVGGVTRQCYDDIGRVASANINRVREGLPPLYRADPA